MNLRNCFLSLLAFGLVIALTAAPLSAQTRVGEAAVVKNEVLRVAAAFTTQIKVGDGLVRDETVRTGLRQRHTAGDGRQHQSFARAQRDAQARPYRVSTTEHHYRNIAVRMTSGTFRFVTGRSDKAAYKITTPLATIGVRGTTLDILSQRGQTIVNLQEGAASVCTVSFECIQLTRPGDTAIITAERRQVDDQEDQQPALDVCRDLQRRCGALQHDAICGRVAGHRR